MKILVACEESQAVTIAFRSKGHEAYSCDILPCSGGHPEWHLQLDAVQALLNNKWDLVISFPPCTDLSVSGSKWFKTKRLSGEQESSINFFLDVWYYSNCVENPKNIMSGWRYLSKWFPHIVDRMKDMDFPLRYTQSIQPWQFGHKETKDTWLWLKGLPKLQPANIVGPMPIGNTRTEKLMIKRQWNKVHRCPPGPNRSLIRSKTYHGIANAMADQWSNL
jgi:hypothetical protein